MNQRYQYQSVNNGNSFADENYNNGRDPHSSSPCSYRLPLIVVVPALLFAAFVAHITTIAYIGSTRRSEMLGNTMGSGKGNSADESDKAQAYAKKKFNEYLFDPSKEAEEFYRNSTNVALLASKGNGTEEVPPVPPKVGCTATIMLIRHCEAGVAREHCGYMGSLRSEFIATLFGNSANDRWPAPDFIFAMAEGERHNKYVKNWREIETVIPLSEKVNVSINEDFGFPEKKKLVKHIYNMLRSGEMCDKLAIVSWKHHDIPHFAHSLGCGPENGCPLSYGEEDYETIWELTYSYHKEKYAPFAVEDTSKHGMHKRHPWGLYPEWFIYGTMQTESFDPLKYAKAKENDGSN